MNISRALSTSQSSELERLKQGPNEQDTVMSCELHTSQGLTTFSAGAGSGVRVVSSG